MARPSASLLPSLLPPIFSIVALVFSALSLTSKDWAYQRQYSDRTNVTTQTTPIYTIYRSPFQICSVVAEDVTLPLQTNLTLTNPPSADSPSTSTSSATSSSTSTTSPNPDDISTVDPDSTANDDSSAQDQDQDQKPPLPDADSSNIVYTQICQKFKPGGRGKTSCELPTDLGRFSPADLQIGDRRQCQQIHYAGNFSIASTAFIGLGLLCSLIVLATATLTASETASYDEAKSHQHEHQDKSACLDAEAEQEQGRHPHHSAATSEKRPRPSSLAPHVNLVLLVSLSVGIACAIVAQFYGILGLVQSASNNGDFIISHGNSEHHDPWVEGRALNTFVTLAWGFAALAAGSAGAVWRVPRFQRV